MNDQERFDKFTERARKVLSLAQEEAQRFNHNYIGTEHLLLGLVREGDGVAAKVLSNLGVELNKVRSAVEFIIGRGDRIVLGDIGLTPRAKKVMELAVDEARRLNHRYIGTEHILLGLIREGEGIAAGVLRSLGLDLERVRAQTIQVLALSGGVAAAQAEQAQTSGLKNNVVTCRLDDATLSAVDALVEAGVRATRSEAAAWLISAGIETNRELFVRVNATVAEIRRLRAEAQAIAAQAIAQQTASAEQPTQASEAEETDRPAAPEDEGSQEGDN
jgi:ATP-dependent Clp protease ATP-binding subunit ClpA